MASSQRIMARGLLFLGSIVVLSGAVGGMFRPVDDDSSIGPYTGTAGVPTLSDLRRSLEIPAGDTEIRSLQQDRTNAILDFSSRFHITARLAAQVHDEAVRAGLDPELAFRLVNVESKFNPRARSPAGAIGLAQVQLATALHYDRRITEQGLLDPVINLRIGFRYLRDLHDRYGNDMRMALQAYNVGPSRLQEILDGGRKPADKYASIVLNGYPAGPRVDLPR